MGDLEEVQKHMKADMLALKDHMASMMEAMLGMERLVESNAAAPANTSTATEADPVLQPVACLAHHHTPDMGGRVRDTVGHANGPRLR